MPGFSRRRFIEAGAGLAVAGAAFATGIAATREQPAEVSAGPSSAGIVPFHGPHQAGIETAPPERLLFAAFDLATDDRRDLASLLRTWTDAAARLTAGRPAATDTAAAPHTIEAARHTFPAPDEGSGAVRGSDPGLLTLTFGFGPGMFTRRGLGLERARPQALIQLPPFTDDDLDPLRSHGDLCVQACGTDAQVVHDAVRTLARLGEGRVRLRWAQEGFQPGRHTAPHGETSRNLLGFKDGTNNPRPGTPLFDSSVWVADGDGPAWMSGGSYLVTRRIRILLERWDAASLQEQERTVGRMKVSGAPLGRAEEHDAVDLSLRDAEGVRVLGDSAHVRVVNQDAFGAHILRRSYSYSEGVERGTGQFDAGLFFMAYQRDPRTQFVRLQSNLSHSDALNAFTRHVGSALFAVPPGVREGESIGDRLLA